MRAGHRSSKAGRAQLDFLVPTVRLKKPAEPAEAKTRLGLALNPARSGLEIWMI